VKTLGYDKSMEYVSQTQTLIGQQRKRLQDLDTGELIEVDQITKRALGQKQFWKVYLMDFLQVLGVLDSKQVDVLIYILENTESANNTFIGSQRDISERCNVSLDTVSRIMRKLQENGFIKQIKRSVYQISPTIMMKGSEHKKSLLLNYYADEDQNEE
jgi:predicted transcriptional regulator